MSFKYSSNEQHSCYSSSSIHKKKFFNYSNQQTYTQRREGENGSDLFIGFDASSSGNSDVSFCEITNKFFLYFRFHFSVCLLLIVISSSTLEPFPLQYGSCVGDGDDGDFWEDGKNMEN